MSEAGENGVFRSKVFGGFDKKQVFAFFNELKRQFGVEKEDLQKENKRLLDENEQAKAKIEELSDSLDKLENEQNDTLQALNQLQNDLAKRVDDASDKLRESIDENAKIKTGYDKLSDDYAALKDICIRLKESNAATLAEYEKLKSDNVLLAQSTKKMMNQLEAADNRAKFYEQSNKELILEIERLKGISKSLSERLRENDSRESYRQRYDDLTQKVLSTQSEISALKNILDDEHDRREKLEAALDELDNIDISKYSKTETDDSKDDESDDFTVEAQSDSDIIEQIKQQINDADRLLGL